MSAAQRYFPRSPRYVFRAEDQTLMRYAAMETRGTACSTKVLNLSESGLLFAMKEGEAPEEGDVLKIEFPIPGRRQIACFATVVRVDATDEWHPDFGESRAVVVGLQFRHLPDGHRRALKNGLQGKTEPEELFDWREARNKQLMTFAGLSLALIVTMMVLSTPPERWIAFCKSALILM